MSPTAFAFFCAFAFVATAAVLATLAARPSRPIGLGRVALALAVLAAVTAAFVVATAVTPVRMNVFGRLQLLWIDLALVVPAASLLLLALRRRGRAVLPAVVALAWLGTCAIPLSFYAMVVEPNRLVVERATLAAREPLSRPIRIGVLSDIQCSTVGEHEREAVRRIMAERPDLIVIAGDLFQGTPAHFARTRADFIALLRGLSAPGGVFVVRGDVDSDSRTKSHFDDLTEAAGVRVLRDELATVEVEGQKVELYGYDRWTDDRRSLRAYLAIPRARAAPPASSWPTAPIPSSTCARTWTSTSSSPATRTAARSSSRSSAPR